MARHLGKLQYRFNRRLDLPRMVLRLLCTCALTETRIEKWLRSGEARGLFTSSNA